MRTLSLLLTAFVLSVALTGCGDRTVEVQKPVVVSPGTVEKKETVKEKSDGTVEKKTEVKEK